MGTHETVVRISEKLDELARGIGQVQEVIYPNLEEKGASCPLIETVRQVAARQRGLVRHSGGELIVDVSAEHELEVGLGRGELTFVLDELVSNSLAARSTKIELSVLIRESAQARSATLTLADDGEGIPAEILSSVTDPFMTSKRNGLGLGLAAVRALMERAGGNLSISSDELQGTVVSADFPERRPQD